MAKKDTKKSKTKAKTSKLENKKRNQSKLNASRKATENKEILQKENDTINKETEQLLEEKNIDILFAEKNMELEKEKAKNVLCPNCGTKAISRFCANCGLEIGAKANKLEENVVEQILKEDILPIEIQKVEETITSDISVVNPVTVPEVPITPSSEQKLDNVMTTMPPVNPMGVPGIMPIPNSGMDHNVMHYQKFYSNISNSKKKNSTIWFIIVIFVLLIIIAVLIYFLLNKKDTSNDVELRCTLLEENVQEGIDSESVMIYLFRENVLIKSINEETLKFSPDALAYYSYFEESLKEMIGEEAGRFDNAILSMKKTDSTLTSIYTVDLTVDSTNPRNDMSMLGYTYQQAKKDLEEDGYICK